MKRILIGTVLFLAGCQFTVPTTDTRSNDDPQTLTDQQRASASDIWIVLAHAVDARTVTSTSQLAQLVAVLARNGDLSSENVAAFDLAFPNATTTDRPLTTEDGTTLRSLK